jgi:hypothetical protein
MAHGVSSPGSAIGDVFASSATSRLRCLPESVEDEAVCAAAGPAQTRPSSTIKQTVSTPSRLFQKVFTYAPP